MKFSTNLILAIAAASTVVSAAPVAPAEEAANHLHKRAYYTDTTKTHTFTEVVTVYRTLKPGESIPTGSPSHGGKGSKTGKGKGSTTDAGVPGTTSVAPTADSTSASGSIGLPTSASSATSATSSASTTTSGTSTSSTGTGTTTGATTGTGTSSTGTTSSSTSSSATSTPTGSLDAISQSLLDTHNEKRALHGVSDLTWSTELADYAQGYADSFTCGSSLVHTGGPYGENLASGYSPAGSVEAWYNEISDYDFSNPGYSAGTGHFTQVVWKSTTQLGCGYKECGTNRYYIICEYAPRGNIVSAGYFEDNVLPLV
ncbi:BA75_00070T0 [Komagataella pastoris]|uniref:BA75_00070T0 n=1 Tax=Komagataella pastoris TaxID=4922 RepID=A0A1B2J5U4_PICPA|nr:BA75_00070T0 [Komagataella pastoris]